MEFDRDLLMADKSKSKSQYRNEIVVNWLESRIKSGFALIPQDHPTKYVTLIGFDEDGCYLAKTQTTMT